MFKFSSLYRHLLCLCVLLFIGICTIDAQTRRSNKEKQKQSPYMHMAFESPLWISNPNTLDNTHKAGFGFRIDFPLSRGPWNFMTGFSHYNFGDHTNLLDISDSETVAGNEGTITFKRGTYAIKYAGLPLGLRLDKKYWSTSFGYQFMFSLNQAELHTEEFHFNFGTEDFEDFSKEKINKVNSALFYSFAGKLPIGARWSFYVEPQIEVLMKPVFKEGIDEVNRANLYLKVGLRHLITLPSEQNQ